MPRPAIAPACPRANPGSPRHHPRRAPLIRRDPRRFARGTAKLHTIPHPEGLAGSSDVRLFAHSFAAAFLFVSVFIA